jgi:hypothetical protein
MNNNTIMTWLMWGAAAFLMYKFLKSNTNIEFFNNPFSSDNSSIGHAGQVHSPGETARQLTEDEQIANIAPAPSGKEYAPASLL